MFRKLRYSFIILTFFLSSIISNPGRAQTDISGQLLLPDLSIGVQLSRSDESGVELSLYIPTYQIESQAHVSEDTQKIVLDGAGQTVEIGKPKMPVYSVLIGVPAGAQITLRVSGEVTEDIQGHFNIAPVPRADFIQEDATSASLVYDQDESAYRTDGFYPASSVQIVDDAWLRDLRVVRIELYPFQYNPLHGSLVWHKQLKVDVQFEGTELEGTPESSYSPNAVYDDVLRGLVMNYDVARSWREMPITAIYHPETSAHVSGNMNSEPVFLGPRYKMVVDHDGLYRVTYEALSAVQPLGSSDPNTFHLYNQGRDVAISIDAGGDGHFGSGDSIYFFGEQFRGDYMAQRYASESINWVTLTKQLTDGSFVPWHPEFNHFMLEKYTDKNVYWLTVGGVGGPQMDLVDGDPTGSTDPIPTTYQTTVRAEPELRHWEQSFTTEDTWFWEYVFDFNPHVYTSTLTGLASGVFSATVRGEIAAYSYDNYHSPDHHTQFFINDRVAPIDDAYWDGKSRYHFEEQVSQSDLLEGVNQLTYLSIDDAVSFPMLLFDFFEVDYIRLFLAVQNKLLFPGEASGTWRYRVGGFTTDALTVYDVTDPISPIRFTNPSINFAGGKYTVTFLASHDAGERYFVAGGYESPLNLSYYQPPDFNTYTDGFDYLFITPPDFITAIQALANYRASQNMATMIVNVDDLYAEFNDGIFHPLAIKNFLAYTFAHWNKPPTYVLLIGDSSWHMKNTNPTRYGTSPVYMPPNLSWVDPWLGQTDSPNLLANVVGDDILPDVLIGRIPVSSSEELSSIISKITSYEQSPRQTWQRNLLFIADDTPDPAGDFVQQSETIINEFVRPGFNALRIYLDDFKDNNLCGTPPFPSGPSCPSVNRTITETVSTTGTLFLNYAGHGSTNYWASEKIILHQVENPTIPDDYTIDDIGSMNNGDKLPVVLSMTCWDGYWFYPITSAVQPSLTEIWLRASGNGAVAVFSATGLGIETGHLALQEGFYDAVFNEGIWNLGSAALAAKLNLYQYGASLDLINTYVTFGDPALHFLSPYQVELSPDGREGIALPGDSVSYSFQVTNQGSIADTVALSVINNIWPTSFPLTIGPIPQGQSWSFDVTVHIPDGADGGVTDNSTLVVTSLGDNSQKDTGALITHSQSLSGVQVSPPSASQYSLPGSAVLYDLQVTNTGNHTDSFVIDTGPHGWQVIVPDLIGPVSRGQSVNLPVTVNIPVGAEDWDTDAVPINLTSQADPNQMASSQLTTVARTYGVSFTPPSSSIEALQGTTVTYTLQVNNKGGYNDSFTLAVDSQWTTEITPSILGPINPAQSAGITVTVDIPLGLPGGAYDEAIVTAFSWGDPSLSGQALLRTIGSIYGLIVRPAYEGQVALPGSTVTYNLQITNTSNISDTYDVTVGTHNWPVTLSTSMIGPLDGNGGTAGLAVNVDIPPTALDWAADSVVITVASQTIPDRIAISTLKTTARLYGVTMTPGLMENEGIPGGKVVYPLKVTNTGGYNDTFTVTASDGWTAEINPIIIGPLEPDTAKNILVTVFIPQDVGDAIDLSHVKVTSWGDPEKSAQSTIRTTSKLFGVALNAEKYSNIGIPGEDVLYELQVTNTSSYADTFTVQVTSGWLAVANPIWIGPLPPHATATFFVNLSIPIDAEIGSYSLAKILVTSRADTGRKDVAYLTTFVRWGHLFLPLVHK